MPAKTSAALVILAVVSLILISTLGNYFLHQRVLDRIGLFDKFLTGNKQEVVVSSLSTTYKTGPNQTHTVTTTQTANESYSALIIRHTAELAEAMETRPEQC